jgi:predicted ATPase
LIVLDNFEQLVEAASDLAALLTEVPRVVALVTSRHVLRVRLEQQYQVAPLAEASAIRLFAERAAAIRPGLEVTDANAPS